MFDLGPDVGAGQAQEQATSGAGRLEGPVRVAAGGSVDDRRLDELGRRGREVAARIAALQGELVGIAAEVASLSGRLAGCTPRAWAAWQWGLAPAEAGRTFRLADRLDDLPELRGELTAGRLSELTVDALASVATPENEARLVETAREASGAQLQSLVRTMRRTKRADEGTRPAEERVSRGLRDDGLWHLHAALSPERGAEVDRAFAHEREHLVEAVRAERAAGTAEEDAPWPSDVDSLLALARAGLARSVRADGSLPERFRTTVVVDADTIAADLAAYTSFDGSTLPPDAIEAQAAERRRLAGEGRCELVGIGAIDATLAAELTCATALSVLVTERGRPVTLTEATRAPTAAQRRALEVRDRTCRYPGCGVTRDLDAHHVDGWALGGPTKIANLVRLCPTHHRTVHRHHLSVDFDGTTARFHAPSGKVLDPAPPRPPPPARPPDDPPTERDLRTGDPLTTDGANHILWTWHHPDGRDPDATPTAA